MHLRSIQHDLRLFISQFVRFLKYFLFHPMWFLKTALSLAVLPIFSIAGYGAYSERRLDASPRDGEIFKHCHYDETSSTDPTKSECPLSSLDVPTLIYPGGQTRCAYDTHEEDKTNATYRFQVHPGIGEAARNLLLFFQGGGVCLSKETCNFIFNTQVEEKTGQPLFQYTAMPGRNGFLSEDDDRNPFHGWTKVVVIYCTGDVHLGNTTIEDKDEKDIHLNGATNTRAVLQWVYHNIPNPRQIFLAGSSAGAIGAQLWSQQVFRHYPGVIQKTFLSDSFPGFSSPGQGSFMQFFRACPLFTSPTFRQACDDETLEMSDVSRSITREFPQVPYAYLHTKSDEVQRMFYCVGMYRNDIWTALAKIRSCISPENYYLGVQSVINSYTRLEPENNVVSYVVDGQDHVILPMANFYTTSVNDVALRDWVAQLTATDRSTRIISSVCRDNSTNVMTGCNAKVLASKFYGQDVRDQFVDPTDNGKTEPSHASGLAHVFFSVSTILSVLTSVHVL